MSKRYQCIIFIVVSLISFVFVIPYSSARDRGRSNDSQLENALRTLEEGKEIFRFDTFGDEKFWGDTLRLHESISQAVDPKTAFAVGLKVDVSALPRRLQRALERGEVDLTDPATTLTLIKQDAVLGVKGRFDGNNMTSIGITCALCHSTVDDSFAPGIGHRLDGWANRDLNVGAIIALAPNLQPYVNLLGVDEDTVKLVLNSWGPGKFDAALGFDGAAFKPDSQIPGAVLIPPAFGLAGVNLHTSTGWGGVSHWNALVAVLEMHGQGTFIDARLKDSTKFPLAAANNFDNVRPGPGEEDLVTSKLPALHLYQLALKSPEPPRDSFSEVAAARGEELFNNKADCARCHVPPLFTEPGWNIHTPEEIGIDDFQAKRGPENGYRTAPLKGLWAHTKGGFYHDGRFMTLQSVIDHYDTFFGLLLSEGEKVDLEEYLKSL
ncbi:hypothetical protein SAMN05216419_10609 [Nitrosomonas cryotolerans]|uniref:Cytochrome c domain-containing protein n=1 Tax=Nitrosomonas cryotolerans ATCC 49181 TaxID=1131553 RepID=A0A1N6HZR5_9PROT|nr:hypothetical protein [Nitrosomonas cryotolerans]SFQ09322.1 hypothetical protein SAMN05216419_10609 [Nitrosomonas cryotolerans]SIO25314.1 hypothetical protein SAMN02743940_1461 [Nitrosomonas cryotolerans ATCC 49181]